MNDYIKHKEYKLPNGRTVTADFNELGCAMVTIQAMDALFDMLNSSQQWIPYSEGSPEEEGVYFVTFNKNCLLEDDLPVMDAIWRDGQWQYGLLESYEHKMPKLVIEPIEELKVIAWMPLPEPYKGEES